MRVLLWQEGTEWKADGLCAETDPEAFFPEKGVTPHDARKICGRCDVQAQCLEWALATNQLYGVWGGTSEQDRKRIKRQRAKALT